MVSPLPQIVTLAQVKKHLRVASYDEDDDIIDKLDQATSLVLDYVYRDDDDWLETILAWTPSTAPRSIQAAILVQCAELYRFRGDDLPNEAPKREHGFLSPAVTAYLHRYRDPSIA